MRMTATPAHAGGYWTENLRAGFAQKRTGWQTSEFLRIENMFNKAYVGLGHRQ